MNADESAEHALLSCYVREVAGPAGRVRRDGGWLEVAPAGPGPALRVRLRRAGLLGDRISGRVQARTPLGAWTEVDADRLAAEIERELAGATGLANAEFAGQVRAGRELTAALLAARVEPPDPVDYLASEQSLVHGHRRHPAPKARDGRPAEVLRWAPEAGARFPLHWLAVPSRRIREEGPTAWLDALDGPAAPNGYTRIPVHPWQHDLLGPLDGVLDLGPGGPDVTPTASVRTVHHPSGGFLKFSLHVRITNCVRKNSAYELAGAVALTRLLRGAADDLAARFPGTTVLAEPAYRTVDGLVDALGVIVRDPLPAEPGAVHLLAAALADEHGPTLRAVLGDNDPLDWWRAYVGVVLPPVLYAYFQHGVVFEPHLQNVVVGVDPAGTPRSVVLRDLEGVKLVPGRQDAALAGLPADVREQVRYDVGRGWQRVQYCLLVNHLAEVLAAVADLSADPAATEAAGWAVVRAALTAHQERFGGSPQLRALLAGAPLPAKANLLTRWARQADRHAGYVMLPSPLAPRAAADSTAVAR